MTGFVRDSKRYRTVYRFFLLPVIVFCVSLGLSGCGSHCQYTAQEYLEKNTVADLENLSQNPTSYLAYTAHTPVMTPAEQAEQFAALREYHFAPWRQDSPTRSKEDAFWGIAAYPYSKGYAENLLPWSKKAMDCLIARQNMETYPCMARYAITVRHSSLRVFPTVKPYFLNPTQAGEGFPFDYFQNSAVHVGTPLFVSHVSVSGKWLYVETSYASGWIPANDVAYVSEQQKEMFMSGTLYALMRDNLALKTAQGMYLSTGFVGGMLPTAPPSFGSVGGQTENVQANAVDVPEASETVFVKKIGKNTIRVCAPKVTPVACVQLLVPARNALGKVEFFAVPMRCKYVAQIPMVFTPRALAELASHIVGQRYGWGGLFEDRDCSSTVRDLFAVFGVWMPRNSSLQADKGEKAISLQGLTAADKRDIIIENGVPFFSLIGMKGHIGIYLGYDEVAQQPIMLHDVWGVRTMKAGQEGRAIIGRLGITSLRPGEERRDVPEDYFYSRIEKLQLRPGTWKKE
ncbi:SH3 domain-containing protein [Halodesulfovibrio sp.]|uniref:SH3 domain-containing protein n=1 Tax=Halodesulfovibrio sp. TaxID=1912772 RepID=UPI0025E3799A|nr:SH3 domain-containing protein [Halodesulfovibrio sp.]MCT4626006.1 SH3 domain-containing protein [Halodesulfovibrio sp.]